PVIYFEHASGDDRELAFIFNLLRGRNYRLYWHFANPFNVRNHRANAANEFGGTVELNVLSVPAGRAGPPHGSEITAPRGAPPRPTLATALSGVAVAEYLPDLPPRATPRTGPAPPRDTRADEARTTGEAGGIGEAGRTDQPPPSRVEVADGL